MSALSVSNASTEPAASFSTSACSLAACLAFAAFFASSAAARLAATSFRSVSGSSSFQVLDAPSRVASSSRTPIAVSASSRTCSQCRPNVRLTAGRRVGLVHRWAPSVDSERATLSDAERR
eukprot:7187090-Prymnesium_polylepis.1